jgi:high-affinity iron transporter
MASSLLITLREGLEAALILGIILAYLARTGHRDKVGAVWLGTVSSIVLSVAAGVAIFLTAGGLEGHAEKIFEGATMVAAAGVLTYMIFWMRRQAIGIRAHLQAQVQTALESGSLWALGLLAFVAVGREGLETVLFMIAAITTASASAALLGGGLGLAAAGVLGYLLYRGTYRLNLRAFFNVTSILLLLFAAGLLAHGLHEFHWAGLVPALVEPVWNTNAVLDERSLLGSFLAALFGYNGDPSLVEVVAYGGYLGLVGWAYFRPPTVRELRATTARVG